MRKIPTVKSLMRSRLKWAGNVKRMEGGRLMKRADTLRVECRRRRGRHRLRCENCRRGRGMENETEG